jgi:hypothetical protein
LTGGFGPARARRLKPGARLSCGVSLPVVKLAWLNPERLFDVSPGENQSSPWANGEKQLSKSDQLVHYRERWQEC